MTDFARTKAVERYQATRPDLEHQLAFFTKLWAIQDEFEGKAVQYSPAGAHEARTALVQHRTLLSLVRPDVPLDAYRDAVRAIAVLMANDAGLGEEQAAALADSDLGAAVSGEALAGALSGFDVFVTSVAASLDDARLSEPLLSFILTEAMTPFLRKAAKAAVASAGSFDWLQWDSGLCPSCGTPASSGIVRDEGNLQGGRRWLSCPVCRTQWEYPRLRCARCGSRAHQDLEYLYDTEDQGHRIHLCASCHGYTPVAFEKELGVIGVPEVEEVTMIRLETVAAERGFTPLGDDTSPVAH
ncbi:MAG: formate dehydrogenase accessory protein FdhE [Coriobacteriia bacterium]